MVHNIIRHDNDPEATAVTNLVRLSSVCMVRIWQVRLEAEQLLQRSEAKHLQSPLIRHQEVNIISLLLVNGKLAILLLQTLAEYNILLDP